ncbi:MAG TPA: hypothetical protein VF960_04615 [Chloroflexota bacterium]
MAETPEDEARTAQIPAQPQVTPEPAAESKVEVHREATVPEVETPRPSPEVVRESTEDGDVMLERLDRELSGLTVGDGFRFGCGFALASAIGLLVLLILMTALLTVGTLMGFKLPV